MRPFITCRARPRRREARFRGLPVFTTRAGHAGEGQAGGRASVPGGRKGSAGPTEQQMGTFPALLHPSSLHCLLEKQFRCRLAWKRHLDVVTVA